MKVGVSSVPLEPPPGLPMAGYIDRTDVNHGVLDPLEVLAFVVEDRGRSLALVVADLLGIPDGLMWENVGVDFVIPIATHTHSGPSPELMREKLLRAGEEAISKACAQSEEVVSVEVMRFPVRDVCSRRDINDPSPLEAGLISWHRRRRPPIYLLFFGCHPTVLGPENTMYSGDLAACIRRALSRKYGGTILYLNSCAGNISTHYTRRSRTYAEIERLTEVFLDQVPSGPWRQVEINPLSWQTSQVELPVVPRAALTPVDERASVGARLARSRAPSFLERVRTAEIAFLRLGEIGIFFHPFELFLSTCSVITSALKGVLAEPFVVGYAMAYRPYIVPVGREGTYEWFASVYAPDAEEVLLVAVRDLIKKVFNQE